METSGRLIPTPSTRDWKGASSKPKDGEYTVTTRTIRDTLIKQNKPKRKRGISVTVCIAAIYNNATIIGVSDRMITAGDIQFEPPSPKIFNVTNSIAILTAGDANIQSQVINSIAPMISAKIDAAPDKWLPVNDVAELYRDAYITLRKNLAEKAILAPYGLDYDSFIARQKEMSPDFLGDVATKLQRYGIEQIEAIITGVDETGAHIFVVRDDELSCEDKVGFASVGIGSNHALSHFMLAGYARTATEPKALLTIHQAKKKAEVSPGVGQDTDLFLIGPAPGTYQKLDPHPEVGLDVVKSLDEFYLKYKKSIERLDTATEEKIQNFLTHLADKSSPPQKAESQPGEEKEAVDGKTEQNKKPKKGKSRKAA